MKGIGLTIETIVQIILMIMVLAFIMILIFGSAGETTNEVFDIRDRSKSCTEFASETECKIVEINNWPKEKFDALVRECGIASNEEVIDKTNKILKECCEFFC